MSKKFVSRICGVCRFFNYPFPDLLVCASSGWLGRSALIILSVDLIHHCSLDLSCFVDKPNSAVMDQQRNNCSGYGCVQVVESGSHLSWARKLQVALTTLVVHILSVSILITVLDQSHDCGVIYNPRMFHRWVCWDAVICIEREIKWGENISLRDTNTDSCAVVWIIGVQGRAEVSKQDPVGV